MHSSKRLAQPIATFSAYRTGKSSLNKPNIMDAFIATQKDAISRRLIVILILLEINYGTDC